MRPTLVHIPYSPWSRRTRLALERMGVEVERKVYTPTLSEPGLRWALGRWRGRVTVPVLLRPDGPPLTDSFDIVCWASDRSETPLAPPELRAALREWDARAEAALSAGRQLTTLSVLDDPEALRASLPPLVRRLGPVGMAIGRDASWRLLEKYGDGRTEPAWEEDLACYVADLDRRLEEGEHLLGRPSYADLLAASGLAFVRPDAGAHVPDPARACWTRQELVDAYPRVFAWQDRVLAP
jgi:glutathione S-transferase